MFSTVPVITEAGMTLLLRAAAGEQITFTRFQIGSGTPEEEDPRKVTALDEPRFYVSITSSEVHEADEDGNGFLELQGYFDNQTYITEDFRWTELGLLAKDEDDVEYLYAYANDGDNAGTLKRYNSDVITEQTFSVIVAIGDSENITAYVIPNATYARKADFDAHVNDMNNPHGMTIEQLGAAAASHNHSASDINSGILEVTRGGTGVNNLDDLFALFRGNYDIGFFTGDGSLRKDITLGYQPSRVFLFALNTGKALNTSYAFSFAEGANYYHSGCTASYATCSASTLLSHGHGGAAVTSTGFAVGCYPNSSSVNTSYVNANDVIYMYIALK